MEPRLSLTSEELEVACMLYYSVIQSADAIEEMLREIPSLTGGIAKKNVRQLHLLRTQLRLGISAPRPLKSASLRKIPNFPSERTIQRDLAKLRDLQVIVETSPKGKGQWGHPKSRTTTYGHPASEYLLNPMLIGNPLANYSLDTKTGKLYRKVFKLLLGTSGFKDAMARTLETFLKMMPHVPAMVQSFRAVPELDNLPQIKDSDFPPSTLERIASIIPEELVQMTIPNLLLPFEGEGLSSYGEDPRCAEGRRISLCLGW